jgi:hypothetical protein
MPEDLPSSAFRISSFTPLYAVRGLEDPGVIVATTGLMLHGELVADDPPPVTVYAMFTDRPRPLPGRVVPPGVTFSLTLAELPGWLAVLSQLPAVLTVWHQQAKLLAGQQDIHKVILMGLGADDDAIRRAQGLTRGFREPDGDMSV